MGIKGMEAFRSKLPGFQGKKFYLLGVISLVSFITALVTGLVLDGIPRWFQDINVLHGLEPVMPIITSAILDFTGYFILFFTWHDREKLLKENKETAFQRGLIRGLVGIPFVVSVVVRAYIGTDYLSLAQPENPVTVLFSKSLLGILTGGGWWLHVIQLMAGSFFLVLGGLTIHSAIQAFGIDYMSLVYMYYPEESEMQDNEIYSIIRHPTYLGIILIAFGGAVFRLSVYSLIFSCIVVIGFYLHVTLVEEKELEERFGEGYKEYRQDVPAFFFHPKNIPVFLGFLKNPVKKQEMEKD
ncbi:hypothetical protein GF325_18105 [Candidatus Bathyarchaeota archaeon]|nr:hypothetical protein [Candidatus Bathyarchaeota archaeon]